MIDFTKIKSLMKSMNDEKLVIMDDDQAYVVVTLSEYQRLLESSKFVGQVQSKASEQSEAEESDPFPPDPKLFEAVSMSNGKSLDKESLVGDIESNPETELVDDFLGNQEITYENINNDYSEEPL